MPLPRFLPQQFAPLGFRFLSLSLFFRLSVFYLFIGIPQAVYHVNDILRCHSSVIDCFLKPV